MVKNDKIIVIFDCIILNNNLSLEYGYHLFIITNNNKDNL